jgi:hypothetical protein
MRLGRREHAPNTRVAFRSSSSAQIQPANDPLAQVTAGEPRCHDGIARERRVGRYYDPATDQFLSVDPDVAETGQPYVFTGDDPLNATDPNGLIPSVEASMATVLRVLRGGRKLCLRLRRQYPHQRRTQRPKDSFTPIQTHMLGPLRIMRQVARQERNGKRSINISSNPTKDN